MSNLMSNLGFKHVWISFTTRNLTSWINLTLRENNALERKSNQDV
jgi:hypothetical protein